MKGIKLKDWQVNAAKNKELTTIVLPMKIQPRSHDFRVGTVMSTTGSKSVEGKSFWVRVADDGKVLEADRQYFPSPLGLVGDQVYVKETWTRINDDVVYRADGHKPGVRWSSSQTMKQSESRLRFEIMKIECRPVQSLTEAEAKSCGIPVGCRARFNHIPYGKEPCCHCGQIKDLHFGGKHCNGMGGHGYHPISYRGGFVYMQYNEKAWLANEFVWIYTVELL